MISEHFLPLTCLNLDDDQTVLFTGYVLLCHDDREKKGFVSQKDFLEQTRGRRKQALDGLHHAGK